jgi:uncharacterized repeat protein (TIGR03803 family)
MNWQKILILWSLLSIGAQARAVTEKIIHAFAGGEYSAYPDAGLVFDASGNAYGTATGGGAGYGTIYQLVPSLQSQSAWTANLLYSFDDVTGSSPGALVLDQAGNLYGTATYGGNMAGICNGSGCGTVFELQKVSGGWQIKVLYTFSGDTDGAHPIGGLVFDKSGNLFGTASYAGNQSAYGTVFELSPSAGAWTESTVYTFQGNGDGANPIAGLTAGGAGVFYGTTERGGAGNLGTVYQLTKVSSGWKETILHSFNGKDGSLLTGGALLLRQGTLYDTTDTGGTFNQGTIFSLTPSTQTFTVLYSFNGTDGGFAGGGMVSDSAGNLYGVTTYGGKSGYGVVFILSEVNGVWQESVLHDFTGASDGELPLGTPTIHQKGLFGTTNSGGEWGAGVVWEVTAD